MKAENAINVRKLNLSKYAVFIIFVIICVALAMVKPAFLSGANILNVLRQMSITGYIAVGMLFVIITGGIDLSAGVIVGLSGVIGANFCHPGQPIIAGILVAVGIGALCGAISGILIGYAKLPAFISTLGVKLLANGAALIYSEGKPTSNLSKEFLEVGGGRFLGIPTPVVILIGIIIIGAFLLNNTTFGRRVYAIGGNKVAAQLAGVNVKLTEAIVYVICGALSGLSGIVLASRVNAGSPVAGTNYEMDAITICVIGGCSLSGGSGSIVGTIAGMLLISVISNGMNMLDVSSYWQLAVKGIVILLAVLFDTYSKKKK